MGLTLRERQHLSALRSSALGLDGSGGRDPAQIVRSLFAMQAQDLPGVRLSVALRGRGLTEQDVDAALAAGTVVRSWPMRGTLHLTAPEDLRWMMRIADRRQATALAKRRADLGITDGELDRAERTALDALAGGRALRRDALLAAFAEHGVPTDGQRGYHLLVNLAHRGVLVFGPPDGKQPTFAILDEWIGMHRDLTGDEALAELALRYFTGHGPATVQDLAWWAGITLGQARTGLAIVAGQLEQRELDGTVYWSAPGLEPARDAVRLLPGFDEFMLGYQDRSVVLDAVHAPRIVPGNNGVFRPTIVVRGFVAGTWRRTVGRKTVTIEPMWFAEPSRRALAGLEAAARRIGDAVGVPAVIR